MTITLCAGNDINISSWREENDSTGREISSMQQDMLAFSPSCVRFLNNYPLPMIPPHIVHKTEEGEMILKGRGSSKRKITQCDPFILTFTQLFGTFISLKLFYPPK